MIPIEKINRLAKEITPEVVIFLRELIAIPSFSGKEQAVIERIGNQMAAVGFDEVRTDGMGNLIGRIGAGRHIMAIDGHADTVGIGNPDKWPHHPFQGKLAADVVHGRGAADMKGALASMIYAGRLIKTLGLEDDYTLYITVTVQEEDCEGLCWDYIINIDKIVPEAVILGEATNLQIRHGQRGRAEIEIFTEGRSCHASVPDRGTNAIYKIIPLVKEIKELNSLLPASSLLGKGSISVTRIHSLSPSLNAVPDRAGIFIDRRLVAGETLASLRKQIEELDTFQSSGARMTIAEYDQPSYSGYRQKMQKFFPAWILNEDHPLIKISKSLFQDLYHQEAVLGTWDFSTNGVTTAGVYRIPTIGFGPAEERYAHTIEEQCPVYHLTEAMKFYAVFPAYYTRQTGQD